MGQSAPFRSLLNPVARAPACSEESCNLLRRPANNESMDADSETTAGVAFGRFRVLPHRRELLADGRPVELGGRAFDVPKALIEARGEVAGKDALMARVARLDGAAPSKRSRLYSSIIGADPSANRSFPANRVSSLGYDCGQPLRGISF